MQRIRFDYSWNPRARRDNNTDIERIKKIEAEYLINRGTNVFMYSLLARFIQCRISTALLVVTDYLRPHCGLRLHVISYKPPRKQSKREKFPYNQRLSSTALPS